jgi:hypothetical protein
MTYSREKIRMTAPSDNLHVIAVSPAERHIKVVIDHLGQYDWGKGAEFLTSLNFIDTILYIFPTWVRQ